MENKVVALRVKSFDVWREQARQLLAKGVSPEKVKWGETEQMPLFEDLQSFPLLSNASKVDVPAEFFELAQIVACHRSPNRWNILYALLWRLQHGQRNLLKSESDVDVRAALIMRNQVRNDLVKMESFLRFKQHSPQATDPSLAWYEPAYFVLKQAAEYFAKELSSISWSLYTPQGAAHWDQEKLRFEWRPFTHSDFISLGQNHSKWSSLWKNHYSQMFGAEKLKVKGARAA